MTEQAGKQNNPTDKEIRRAATFAGGIAALPAGWIGLKVGVNLVGEIVGDEAIMEIDEARDTGNEAVLREHNTDMLLFIGGSVLMTLTAGATAYRFVKKRAISNFRKHEENKKASILGEVVSQDDQA